LSSSSSPIALLKARACSKGFSYSSLQEIPKSDFILKHLSAIGTLHPNLQGGGEHEPMDMQVFCHVFLCLSFQESYQQWTLFHHRHKQIACLTIDTTFCSTPSVVVIFSLVAILGANDIDDAQYCHCCCCDDDEEQQQHCAIRESKNLAPEPKWKWAQKFSFFG
jgi:hypothetical protein